VDDGIGRALRLFGNQTAPVLRQPWRGSPSAGQERRPWVLGLAASP